MVILIASDSFKGSLSSTEICRIATEEIRRIASDELLSTTSGTINPFQDLHVIGVPLADGGEGSVDALVVGTGGRYVDIVVHDPLMGLIPARYGILGNGGTAVIEMASASGLTLVPENLRNPLHTTSLGTGELIRDSVAKGCREIILCIGGSATNDGGVGMLKALGFKFTDAAGNDIADGGQGLLQLTSVDMSEALPALQEVTFRVACDVDNPLLGERGATMVYAPQKGAKAEDLPLLEKGILNFSAIMTAAVGKDVSQIPGAGAAGGMGAGLMGYLGATLEPGFPLISDMVGLRRIMSENAIDLVVTGEGSMDRQTLNGKLPYGVIKLAKSMNVPVIAIVGRLGEGHDILFDHGLVAAYGICDESMPLKEAMDNAVTLYAETLEKAVKDFIVKDFLAEQG